MDLITIVFPNFNFFLTYFVASISNEMKNIEKPSTQPKLIILTESEWLSIREDIAFLKNAHEKKVNQSLGEWMSEPETQLLLHKKATSLWRLRKNKIIVAKKIGGANYYNRQSIIDFLNSQNK